MMGRLYLIGFYLAFSFLSCNSESKTYEIIGEVKSIKDSLDISTNEKLEIDFATIINEIQVKDTLPMT